VEEEADESIYWMEVATEAGWIRPALVADLLKEGNEILANVVASIKTARRQR
jgi:hypothetical protein